MIVVPADEEVGVQVEDVLGPAFCVKDRVRIGGFGRCSGSHEFGEKVLIVSMFSTKYWRELCLY